MEIELVLFACASYGEMTSGGLTVDFNLDKIIKIDEGS